MKLFANEQASTPACGHTCPQMRVVLPMHHAQDAVPAAMQVVTHSQRFASLSETVLRLDRGEIAYMGAPNEDPFRLWGPEPGAAQVALLSMLSPLYFLCHHAHYFCIFCEHLCSPAMQVTVVYSPARHCHGLGLRVAGAWPRLKS